MLFSGSLRFNLDPSAAHGTDELWRALELSHLASFVKTLPDQLEYECGEDGKNLRLAPCRCLYFVLTPSIQRHVATVNGDIPP